MSAGAPLVTVGTLAGGRPFRMAVGAHALGVHVAPAPPRTDPFVAVVNHPVTNLARWRELAAVVDALHLDEVLTCP